MATIKECDRCGYQQTKDSDYKKVYPVEVSSDHYNDKIDIVRDLCTDCKDALKAFMNEKLPRIAKK